MNSIRKEWDALQAAAADYGRKAAAELLGQCRQGLLTKIAAEAIHFSKFGSMDEALYVHCAWLMAVYEKTVAFCKASEADIASPEVKKIIDGIITILVSRLREFEEAALTAPSSSDGSNPIADEKRAIVAQTVSALKKVEPKAEIETDEWLPAQWIKDELTNVKASLLEIARVHAFSEEYAFYLESLALCQSHLNDFERRKTVQLYQTLMEDEFEILSTIIKIQVMALEQGLDAHSIEKEKIAVHKILSMLREAYQRFGRAATEMATIPEQKEQYPEAYEDFEAFLITCWQQAEVKEDSALKDNIGIFKAKIEKEAEILLGRCRLDFFKSLYRFRGIINEEMALANKMADIFTKMQENWPNPQSACEGAEILKGVAETIEIKIEGLRESISQIAGEYTGIIESFAAENAAPTDEAVQSAKAAIWQLWADSESKLQNNFKQNCRRLPIFTERLLAGEKSAARCQESLNKKSQKFKRETLLYEVSTYEEIIIYSISRLRQLESSEFQQAAVIADDALNQIEALLIKSSIELIRPQPHEPFNSKEHEVLMAESNPDFKKGEIIKMMNSGYRQNDVVLLRANVIAAR